MILNHLSPENDDIEAILSPDDSEGLEVIGEADLGVLEANTGIVRDALIINPSDMTFALTPERVQELKSEIIRFGTDPISAKLCQSILDHLPSDHWIEMPANLARLAQLKKAGKLPSWWNRFVEIMLDTDKLRSLNAAARELDISRFIISSFCHTHGLQSILACLKQTNQELATDRLEAELFDRALDKGDKYSATLLIFALKGNRQHKYKEGSQVAVQVNNGPTSWSIDPITIADKPRT